MSIRYPTTVTTSEWLYNAGALSSPMTGTLFARVYFHSGIYGTDIRWIIHNNSGGSSRQWCRINTSGQICLTADGGTNTYISSSVGSGIVDQWLDVAFTLNGAGAGNATLYFKPHSEATWTVTGTTTVEAGFTDEGLKPCGAYGTANNSYLSFCHIRAWNSVLTSGELLTECGSASAVKASPIYDCPCPSYTDVSDQSGSGNNMTKAGSGWRDGPANPTFSSKLRSVMLANQMRAY